MTERVTPEMLEAATHVAAWSGDWIHSDSLPAIYEAMREHDPDCLGAEWEMERVLQEAAFVHGAQACREMMARFVEQGGTETERNIACSIRANWRPGWGEDPGPLPGSIPYNAFGETEETDKLLAALAAGDGGPDYHGWIEFRAASGIEAPSGVETGNTDSTEGESPTGEAGDAQDKSPSPFKSEGT